MYSYNQFSCKILKKHNSKYSKLIKMILSIQLKTKFEDFKGKYKYTNQVMRHLLHINDIIISNKYSITHRLRKPKIIFLYTYLKKIYIQNQS